LEESAEISSKERSLERSDAIEVNPANPDSDSMESENEDEDDISAGKIDPQVLNAISNIYTSVR